VQVKRKGPVTICMAPLIWGKPPPTCESIQTEMPKVYVTERIMAHKSNASASDFFKSLSSETPLALKKDDDTCLQSTEHVLPGTYILSILPKSEKNIVLGFIMVP
jgi:hypothetical protein